MTLRDTDTSKVVARVRVSALPPSCPPRGLSRVAAAEYINVSVTKFDEMVEDGRMPKPKSIDRRKVWDLREIDDAFSALPTQGAVNEWDAWYETPPSVR